MCDHPHRLNIALLPKVGYRTSRVSINIRLLTELLRQDNQKRHRRDALPAHSKIRLTRVHDRATSSPSASRAESSFQTRSTLLPLLCIPPRQSKATRPP